MKTLAVLLSLWTFQVHAAEECKSVWVYKPWKTCSDSRNGLDLSKATSANLEKTVPTRALDGKVDPKPECDAVGKTLQMNLPEHALVAERQSISDGKSSRDILQQVTYVYQCTFKMMKVPYKTRGEACGTEDKYNSQSQGTNVALEGRAHCLSCDDGRKDRSQLASCIKYTAQIWSDVAASGVQLRQEELKTILNRVELMLKTAPDNFPVEDYGKIVVLKDELKKEIQ